MFELRARLLSVACGLLVYCVTVQAGEGMWLFNSPPSAVLKSKYNFDVSPAWLEHPQKASVRFDNGGSGSFVSPHGLAMTNQHVGTDCVRRRV